MRRLVKIFSWSMVSSALLWSAYWFAAAAMIEDKIELAFSQQSSTATLGLSAIEVSGFPTEFDIELHDFSVFREGAFSWSTEEARLTAASFDPTRLAIDLSHPHAIGGRFGDLVLDTDQAQVIALFGKSSSLPLQDLRFALTGAKLDRTNGFGLEAEKVIAVIQNREGEDPGVYRVETEVTGANISRIVPNLPAKYQRLGPIVGVLDAFFTSSWAAGDLAAPFPVFRGAILQKLSASLGESELMLAGKLQFNPDGSVSGEVTLTVKGWRDLLSAVKDMGKIDADAEELFSEMLADIEALSGKADTLELPLVIKNGAVTYGVFTLGLIPPIR